MKPRLIKPRILWHPLFYGAMAILVYAPFHQAWLTWLILSLAFYHVSIQTPAHTFKNAFYFGCGYYGLGISWVLVSVSTFVEPLILAILISMSLILFMSVVLAIFFGMLQTIPSPPLSRLLFIYPLGATFYEWAVTNHLLQFPWLNIGVAMIDTPIGNYASLVSVLGVSYLTFLGAGILATRRIIIIAFWGLMIGLGSYLASLSWTTELSYQPRISAIQANIGVHTKWLPEELRSSLRVITTLTEANWGSDWVIWPENALAALYSDMRPFLEHLDQKAKAHHTALVVGLPIDQDDHYFNSALILGQGEGRYDKHHLVPFGEYPPFEWLLSPLLEHFNIPMSHFSEGSALQPLPHLKGTEVAIFSCFETLFFEHLRHQLQSAKAIIIMSDDGWFGHSFAAAQQFQMSRMRAKELGRSLITVGNTGITGLIDYRGQVQITVQPHERIVLNTQLALRQGETPWVHYGPFCWIFLIGLCTLSLTLLKKFDLLFKKK